ncbi:MAG: dUTP diphosphatase [Myxococcota bacterium]
MTCQLKIKRLRPDALLPRYMSDEAAGMDLFAVEETRLAPGERASVPTGIALAIAPGYEGQVRPRSGLALRHGVTVANAPGTIDADYRGELRVILVNLGREELSLRAGDRVAQLVIAAVARADVREVDALDDTARGGGGFGHTGR